MSFIIEQRERDGIPILALKGRLVLGDPLEKLRERLRAQLQLSLATGTTALVLDCRDTSYIDSSGLGCLVMAHSRAMQLGGKFPIFGLNRRGLELMILTKLSTVFEIYEFEIDAVNSCFADRRVQHFDILDFVQRHRAEADQAKGSMPPQPLPQS
ncbi:MAG: STAS domain-containing protein [Bryobacteraceae bacterium]